VSPFISLDPVNGRARSVKYPCQRPDRRVGRGEKSPEIITLAVNSTVISLKELAL